MPKITAAQFFVLLFLCRAFSFFTMTSGGGNMLDTSLLLSVAVSTVLQALVLVPAWLILRGHEDEGILEYACRKSRAAGIACQVFFGALLLLAVMENVARYEMFVTSAIYPNEKGWLFIALFALAAMYLVWMGLESTARLSAVVLVALVASAGIIAVSLLPQFQWENFASPLIGGAAPVARQAVSELGETAELMLVLLFVPYIRGGMGKGFLIWLAAVLLAAGAALALTIGTVGGYAVTQTYPLYAVAKMAKLFYFQRMDALHMVVWTMVGLVKTSLYLIMCRRCFAGLAPRRAQRWILPVAGAAAIAGALALTYVFGLYGALGTLARTAIPLVAAVLVIPVLLWLIPAKKGEASR